MHYLAKAKICLNIVSIFTHIYFSKFNDNAKNMTCHSLCRHIGSNSKPFDTSKTAVQKSQQPFIILFLFTFCSKMCLWVAQDKQLRNQHIKTSFLLLINEPFYFKFLRPKRSIIYKIFYFLHEISTMQIDY